MFKTNVLSKIYLNFECKVEEGVDCCLLVGHQPLNHPALAKVTSRRVNAEVVAPVVTGARTTCSKVHTQSLSPSTFAAHTVSKQNMGSW